jgi:hypothetical protein
MEEAEHGWCSALEAGTVAEEGGVGSGSSARACRQETRRQGMQGHPVRGGGESRQRCRLLAVVAAPCCSVKVCVKRRQEGLLVLLEKINVIRFFLLRSHQGVALSDTWVQESSETVD